MVSKLKKTQCLSLLLLFVLASALVGCGEKSISAEKQAEAVINWKQKGFEVSDKLEEEQKLWIKEYIRWEHSEVEYSSETENLYGGIEAGTRNGKIYRLNTVLCPPEIRAVRWILEIFDTNTMQSEVQELSYEQLGIKQPDSGFGIVADMDVITEGEYILQWIEVGMKPDQNWHMLSNRMIYWNSQKEIGFTDLWDRYLEKEIKKDVESSVAMLPEGYCVCDYAGNTYVRAGEGQYGYSDLYVFDRAGNVLMEFLGDQGQSIQNPMRTEEGELIFPVYDAKEKSYHFMWPDLKKQEMRDLAVLKSSQTIRQMYGMQGNEIYYETPQGVVQWNVESGKRTLVLSYRENGIAGDYQSMLVFRNGSAPILRLFSLEDTTDDWLVLLSYDRVIRKEDIRVADLVNHGENPGSQQVSECASLVSRKNKNDFFAYEKAELNQKDYKSKIFAEIAAGKGPDVLYVSREDMGILSEKDALMDLRDLISEEELGELLPGALELGTMDGKLVGIPANVNAIGLVVSRDIWSEDSWNMNDMLNLMRKGTLERGFYLSDDYMAPLGTIRFMTEFCMNNKAIIDWENRTCHFNEEPFFSLLDITNIDIASLPNDNEKWLGQGNRIALFSVYSSDSFYDFGVLTEENNGNHVGFPTEEGHGNYLDTTGVLVVNKNTSSVDAIKEFLKCYLGEEIQGICNEGLNKCLGVKKLNTDELEWDFDGKCFWKSREVYVFEDGTTSLHRAEAFLESCVAAPQKDRNIINILYEELQPLYTGGKNSRQVAEIINNRIQLYLDEGNIG